MTDETEAAFFAHLALHGLAVENPVRLAGGRSNYVWRAGNIVVKLYRECRNNPLFSNDAQLEQASLTWLAGTGMVPRLIDAGTFDGYRWLAYSHITGTVWQAGTAHVAQLLGRLHNQPGFSGLPMGCNGSSELAVQTRVILAKCRDSAHLRALVPSGPVAKLAQPVLIHGDPVPGNLVEHDGNLTLIDWQCPQLGDPAEDLALFLSPAMQLLYRGSPLTQDEEDVFRSAYPNKGVLARLQALKPWFHWRMAAYCQWKAEQGCSRDREAMALEVAALQSMSPSIP